MQTSNQTAMTDDDLEAVVPVITDDVNLLGVPGVLVEMSPDEADSWEQITVIKLRLKKPGKTACCNLKDK